jgi:hypothetical protein
MNHRAQQLFSSWATSREHYVSRRIPLLLRVQKFYDVLGRVFAFGAGGWNLKQTDLKRIDYWERIILRQILGRHRFAEEPWHLYQQRLKHKTEEIQRRLNIMPLSMQCCVAFFGWAGHVARHDAEAPMSIIYAWRDLLWQRQTQDIGFDFSGQVRPRMVTRGLPIRWEDALEARVGFDWRKECLDRPGWASKKFDLAARRWAELMNKQFVASPSPRKALAHISPRMNAHFDEVDLSGVRLLLAVDNMQVACQTNGFWHVPVIAPYAKVVDHIRWMLHAAQTRTKIATWKDYPCFVVHRKREHNQLADSLANHAMDWGNMEHFHRMKLLPGDKILATSDGGYRGPNLSSVGCSMWLYRTGSLPRNMFCIGRRVNATSSVDAEFMGITLTIFSFCKWLRMPIDPLLDRSVSDLGPPGSTFD